MSPSPSPPDIALSCENVSYRSSLTPNACSLPITKSAIVPITNPSTRASEPCSSNTSTKSRAPEACSSNTPTKSRAPVSSLVYPDNRLLSHLDWDWTLLSIILTWLFGLTIQAPEQSKRNKPNQSNRNELKKSKRNAPDQSNGNELKKSKRNEPIHSKRKEKLKHILLVITKLFLCQGWLAVITLYSISDVLLTKIDYSSLLNFQNVGNFFAIFQLSWWSGAVIPLLICWYWQATGVMSLFLTQLNTYRQKYGPTVAATSKSRIAFNVIGIAQMLLFWISYLVLFCFKSLRSCERTSITKSYKGLGIPAFFWLSTACLVFPVISNLCFQSVGEVVDEFQEVVEEIQTTSTTPTPSVIHRLVERYWYILEMVEVLGRMLSLKRLLRGLLGFGKHGHAPDLCGFGVLSKGLLLTVTNTITIIMIVVTYLLFVICCTSQLFGLIMVVHERGQWTSGVVVLCTAAIFNACVMFLFVVDANRRAHRVRAGAQNNLTRRLTRCFMQCFTIGRKKKRTGISELSPSQHTDLLLSRMTGTPAAMKAMEVTLDHSFIASELNSLEHVGSDLEDYLSYRSGVTSQRSSNSFFSTRSQASGLDMAGGFVPPPIRGHSPSRQHLGPFGSTKNLAAPQTMFRQRLSTGGQCHRPTSPSAPARRPAPPVIRRPSNRSFHGDVPSKMVQRKRSRSSACVLPYGVYVPGGGSHCSSAGNTLVVPGLENIVIYRGRAFTHTSYLAARSREGTDHSSTLDLHQQAHCPMVIEEETNSKKHSNSAPPTPINRSRSNSEVPESANDHKSPPSSAKITRFCFDEALCNNIKKVSSHSAVSSNNSTGSFHDRKKSSIKSIRLRMESMVAVL